MRRADPDRLGEGRLRNDVPIGTSAGRGTKSNEGNKVSSDSVARWGSPASARSKKNNVRAVRGPLQRRTGKLEALKFLPMKVQFLSYVRVCDSTMALVNDGGGKMRPRSFVSVRKSDLLMLGSRVFLDVCTPPRTD